MSEKEGKIYFSSSCPSKPVLSLSLIRPPMPARLSCLQACLHIMNVIIEKFKFFINTKLKDFYSLLLPLEAHLASFQRVGLSSFTRYFLYTPLIFRPIGVVFLGVFPLLSGWLYAKKIKVTMTCYYKEEVGDNKTAMGTKPKEWQTLAISKDLDFLFNREFPKWVSVKTKKKGSWNILWKVEDKMHKKWKKRIDLFFPKKICKKFGKRKGWLEWR